MQGKFGLKDFVFLVLIVALGVMVFLAMLQRDREWNQIQGVRGKLSDVERQLNRIETRLEAGVAVSAPVAPTAAAPGAGGRDESWARPGVPIEWQPPWDYATDPHSQPDFRIGGEFTEIFDAQPAKLVPFIQTDVYGRRVVDLVSETLAAYDPKTLRLRGWLAEAWQMDPAGLWLRARIRANARFSDGAPVTAEDVRWGWHEFVMNPQIEAERSRSIYADMIDRVEVVDERTVEYIFKDAFFSNSDVLTMFVIPKHFYSRFQPAQINQATGLLMGSGPYKLERLNPAAQWAPPADVVLVRNEQYWGPKSPLERIRFRAVTNELARLTAYKNGEGDLITPSSPQFVSAQEDPRWLSENQNLNWVNMRSGRYGVIWNCGLRNGKATPFHDQRVRLAMTLLIDREAMIRDIWKGIGEVAVGFFNPGTPGHDPARRPWPYDPARAAELLGEAGWADRNGDRVLEDADNNDFAFELTVFGGSEISERVAKFIKDAAAAAGVRVTIRTMDWSVGEPVRQQRDFDAMLMGWGANAPESDPKQIFHSDSIQNQGDNFGQWSNPAADRAIDLARKELDPAARGALWKEFERIMHEDQPYTWIRVTPFIRFVKPWIGNVNMYPKGLEPWEFYHRGGPSLPADGM